MTAFDLQVNGYAGVDFNDPGATPEDLDRACRQLESDGVGGVLAAVITAAPDEMMAREKNLVRAREESEACRRVIAGIHLEGPFLNPAPGFVGAHPAEHVRPADPELMGRLLEAGEGLVRLVTLAPEADPEQAVTRQLVAAGVVVSAGHCDASTDQLRGAIDAGLSMFTHLGNGCPAQLDRHDNIIQRALALSEDLWISLIPDGHHVPWFALGNFLRAAGKERCLFTTDAMAEAAAAPGTHRLGHLEIEVGEDRVARLPGTDLLAGSTATVPGIREDATRELGLPPEALDALLCENPRRALGLL